MISLDEALERVLAYAEPLGAVHMPLEQAAGHILAAPVAARTSQPPFNASAMDGYAVRGEDVKPGVTLEMIGTSQAGAGFDGRISQGECVRIFTGAPLPEGADTVVMQEKTAPRGTKVMFVEPVEPGYHVRSKGQDFEEGQDVLRAGEPLTPAAIALAAAANNAELAVYRKPNLGILATGNELVEPGLQLSPDQIIASNSVALSTLLAPQAAAVRDFGIAMDDEESLRTKLEEAFSSDADVIITTGGASVGDHDLVQPVLKSLGVEIDFWKIAMRPGKPLMFGKIGNKLVFGLPGNPVSAMVTATTVVTPALRALGGSRSPLGPRLRLPLASALPANGPRRHFVRGVIAAREGGISAVRPIRETDSAHLSSLAQANALIVHREDAEEMPAGEIVDVIPLRAN